MLPQIPSILAIALQLALGTASPLTSSHVQAHGITWNECEKTINGSLTVKCANFPVPLDYTDPKSDEINIQILKVPATNGPARGSLFFNFGGPGVPVRATLAQRARRLQASVCNQPMMGKKLCGKEAAADVAFCRITGGTYDLLGIDPRGTANTLTFKCFANETEQATFLSRNNAEIGNASDTATGKLWAIQANMANQCKNNPASSKSGQFIGTIATAKDMMSVVDALGGDGLLRYWGSSYGTSLGATVAALFPERMDRIILDGVMNFHEYWGGLESMIWADTDNTLRAMLRECKRYPNDCILGRSNATAEELEASIYQLIETIKYNPIPLGGAVIDYTVLKSQIRPALYAPQKYSALALTLHGLITTNLTQYEIGSSLLMNGTNPVFTEGFGDESPYGIHCGDKKYRKQTLNEVRPDLKHVLDSSKLLGDLPTTLALLCSQWKFAANERFEGQFRDIRTRSPVLHIGQSHDPATSIQGAFNTSAAFPGSVVLRQDGFGHCSGADPSFCITAAIRNYLENGILPAKNKACTNAFTTFSGKTWDDITGDLEKLSTKDLLEEYPYFDWHRK